MKVIATLAAAAAILVGVELGTGALGFGQSASKPACTTHATYPGHGLDAVVQRVALDGLYGAACELGTTREQLVLSFDPARPSQVRWDKATIERAVRAGMLRSIEDADRRGELPGPAAQALRFAVENAPLSVLIEGGSRLTGIVGEILSRIP